MKPTIDFGNWSKNNAKFDPKMSLAKCLLKYNVAKRK